MKKPEIVRYIIQRSQHGSKEQSFYDAIALCDDEKIHWFKEIHQNYYDDSTGLSLGGDKIFSEIDIERDIFVRKMTEDEATTYFNKVLPISPLFAELLADIKKDKPK